MRNGIGYPRTYFVYGLFCGIFAAGVIASAKTGAPWWFVALNVIGVGLNYAAARSAMRPLFGDEERSETW